MAGDWIKMRCNLWTHPKVVTLASRLSVTRCHAIGALHGAWSVADQHADESGSIAMSANALDTLIETSGFCAALAEVRWLVIGEGVLQFVDYAEHNGTTAKDRLAAAKRQQLSRSRHAPVTEKRDTTVTREEKRRVDKNTPIPPQAGDSDDAEQESAAAQADTEPTGFLRWWNAWPRHHRKVNRTKCLRKWKREKLENLSDRIFASLERCKVSPDWRKNSGEFIPGPLPWLNKTPWETNPAEMVGDSNDDGATADHPGIRALEKMFPNPKPKGAA